MKSMYPREYLTWHQMKMRCRNPKSPEFENYGARGISVCQSWLSFECFLKDMGARPSDQHSIERKDGKGNYEPGNCVWATKIEQNNNRSNVRKHEFRGQMISIGAAIREIASTRSHATVYDRVMRQGLSLEQALGD